ncbi:CDP-alcohol phosphatidyltransferase family protein [soil metagenome]
MGRFWTLANGLSMVRLLLVPVIGYLVYRGDALMWTFALIGVAVITDYFDGRVARWTGTVTQWGKVLDASADKLAAIAITLALLLRPIEPTLPLWFVLVIIGRDALLAGGGLLQTRRLGRFTSSMWWGKVTVTLLALVVLAALVRADAEVMEVLLIATTAAVVASVMQYAFRFARIMGRPPVAPRPANDGALSERPEIST